MVALAIASVMVFTSCHTEKTEYLDPDAPSGGSNNEKQELEVLVEAEISGTMTKAVSLDINYTDFQGVSGHVVLNNNFDGKKLTFNTEGKMEKKGEEFAICINATKADYTAYFEEKSPYNATCRVIVKHNGREIENRLSVIENPPYDNVPMIQMGIDVAKRFCEAINERFQGKMLYIRLNDKNEVEWVKK